VVDLAPGHYILLCVNPSPTPHWRTEFLPLEVTAPAAQRPAEPEAQATITISDFKFDAPDTLPAGRTVLKATNVANRRHAMAVFRQAGSAAQPNSVAAGGLVEVFPGTTGWAVLDLTPGNYLLICGITDVELKKSHLELGMVHPFTVK